MLLVKGLVRTFLQVAVFAALLFIPAGTREWPRAIQFLVAFAVLSSITTVLLARFAPASLEARLPSSSEEKQPVGDRLASLFLGIMLVAWFLFIPFSVFRLQLLPAPPAWSAIVGGLLLLAGYGVMVTAVVQNAFAIPVVRDQADRGQFVVDTGIYGLVRHPMYLGLLLFLAGLALWLESLAALIAVPLAFAPIFLRILVEEKTLHQTLPGYTDYTKRVRARLIPLLW